MADNSTVTSRLNTGKRDAAKALNDIVEAKSGDGQNPGNFDSLMFEGDLATTLVYHFGDENRPPFVPSNEDIADFVADCRMTAKVKASKQMKGAAAQEKFNSIKEVREMRERFMEYLKGTEITPKRWGGQGVGNAPAGNKQVIPIAVQLVEGFIEKHANGDWNNLMLGDSASVWIFNEETKRWGLMLDNEIKYLLTQIIETVPDNYISAVKLIAMKAYGLEQSVRYREIMRQQRWQEISGFSCNDGVFKFNEKEKQFEFIANASVDRSDLVLTHFPFDYSPESSCDVIMKSINYLLDDREIDVRIFLEHISLGLTSYRQLRRALFIVGASTTGKSTICKALDRFFNSGNMVGEKSVCSSVDISDFEDPNSLSMLSGRRINISSETGARNPSKESLANFKRVTGLDPVKTKILYKDKDVEYINALQVMVGNEMPKMMSDDPLALANRTIKLQSTDRSIRTNRLYNEDGSIEQDFDAHIDTDLLDKMSTKDEFTGLFALLVKSLNDIIKREEYTLTARHIEQIEDALPAHDVMEEFMDAGIVLRLDEKEQKDIAWMPRSKFIAEIRKWILDRGGGESNAEPSRGYLLFGNSANFLNSERLVGEYQKYVQRHKSIPKAKRASTVNASGKRETLYPFELAKDREMRGVPY